MENFHLIIGILNTFLVGYAYSYEVLFLFTKPLIEIQINLIPLLYLLN